MVSCRHKRVRHVFVDCAAIMINQRGFSVHQALRPDNLPPKCLSDNLVPQADSQNRNPPLKEPYGLQADSCFIGGTRPRRKKQNFRSESGDLAAVKGIIAENPYILPHFPQILDKVVGKRIVIVDQQQQ